MPTILAYEHKSILFNDAHANLGPLADLRPPHAIRTGALTTAERLTRAFDLEPIGIVVSNELKELTEDQSGVPVNQPPEESDEPILLINGRCPLPIEAIRDLNLGEVLIEASTKDMVAVCLTSSNVRELLSGGNPEMKAIEIDDTVLMRTPWDWRAFRDRCLDYDLKAIVPTMPTVTEPPTGVMILGAEGVAIHPDAVVMPGVILNSELVRHTSDQDRPSSNNPTSNPIPRSVRSAKSRERSAARSSRDTRTKHTPDIWVIAGSVNGPTSAPTPPTPTSSTPTRRSPLARPKTPRWKKPVRPSSASRWATTAKPRSGHAS